MFCSFLEPCLLVFLFTGFLVLFQALLTFAYFTFFFQTILFLGPFCSYSIFSLEQRAYDHSWPFCTETAVPFIDAKLLDLLLFLQRLFQRSRKTICINTALYFLLSFQ